jgi:hypothetical protein
MTPNETPELPAPAPITEEEWNMAVSLMKDGGAFASLRQSIASQDFTIPISDLTLDQWTAVISQRIRSIPSFQIYMFGAGVIDQQRALTELANHSSVGQALVEIEQNLIRNLHARALNETS